MDADDLLGDVDVVSRLPGGLWLFKPPPSIGASDTNLADPC
jgi:hypothetical protein